ncbi:MAG TPA: hypothetical protein VNV61_14555 [Steroidobacteraceae bacterium]|jgi:hypothetical protein|nr:hypothetical protein [Steroidobacteraceae bacterium]
MNINLSRRSLSAAAGGLLILSGALDGCASSRVLKNPLPPAQANLGWTASAPDGVKLEIHELIFRDGGGSWVKKANWDEYVLTIENGSPDVLKIQGIYLYSDKLPAPAQSSTSRAQLDTQSNGTLRALKDTGIVAGVGIVGPSALIVAGVGTSGGMLSASGAGAAAATVGIIAIPVGLIGGTVYVINRHSRDKKDKVLVQHKIEERGFIVPQQILAQDQATKSAFFPITPAPTRLVVNYLLQGDVRELSLELPGLAGLHLKATHAAVMPAPAANVTL